MTDKLSDFFNISNIYSLINKVYFDSNKLDKDIILSLLKLEKDIKNFEVEFEKLYSEDILNKHYKSCVFSILNFYL